MGSLLTLSIGELTVSVTRTYHLGNLSPSVYVCVISLWGGRDVGIVSLNRLTGDHIVVQHSEGVRPLHCPMHLS